MKPLIKSALIVLCCSTFTGTAISHPKIERSIPFGYWSNTNRPNIYMGVLEAMDVANNTVTIKDTKQKIYITDKTTIWMDFTHFKQQNKKINTAGLTVGREIEYRLVSESEVPTAVWIKIQASELLE